MAESRDEDQPPPSLPPRGRVESVRKQWSVHEDGALAIQMQNEEINQHYGLNRFHRRTVREDIPVAKIVQSEEELKQQEERMRELEALKAQAEEDELIARRVNEQLKREEREVRHVETKVMDDEEIARQMQEKEKKKYERHLAKKRDKKLKQERQRLEAELARDTEEAGLHMNSETGSDRVADSMESLDIQGVNTRRVTPAGKIEDDGDFSDFYRLPDEMDEFTRLEIQASQDEELARLLQEQEHKRSKAEVDRSKLKRIEQQDEELAKVMQEQEKIRLKKAKQKHQQRKEAQKLKESESLPLGASANSFNINMPQHPHHQQMSQQVIPPQQHSPRSMSPTMPVTGGATRYRRNSYTQAFDDPPSPPSPPRSQPPPRPTSNRSRQEHQYQTNITHQHQAPSQYSSSPSSQTQPSFPSNAHSSVYRNPHQQPPPHHLANRPPMPLPSHNISQGMSTLESARRIAAGDHNGILAAQQSSMSSPRVGGGGSMGRDGTGTNVDVIRSSGRGRGQHPRGSEGIPRQLSHGDYRHHQSHHPDDRYGDEMPEVRQWLHNQDDFGSDGRGSGGRHPQQHWQHAISYSDDEGEFGSNQGSPHMNGSAPFNIAAAIDPTYQKKHPEAAIFPPDETQVKRAIPFSRSLPQADGELEWDPGLRGSLRKTKAPIHGYQDSSSVSSVGMTGGDPSWQPVQGQRRGDNKSKKSSKQKPSSGPVAEGKKDKSGNCKQQ